VAHFQQKSRGAGTFVGDAADRQIAGNRAAKRLAAPARAGCLATSTMNVSYTFRDRGKGANLCR
jgi:hypothetical protein